MILAPPVAARLVRNRAPRSVLSIGSALSALGLFGISLAFGYDGLWLMTLAMGVQGFGMGLFQVAYFDIVVARVPARDRGVAGALGMATRTIGTVTGATVLMLVFQTLQDRFGFGFAFAFQATFWLAAAIPAVLIVLDLLGAARVRTR
jgi:MFS family permease